MVRRGYHQRRHERTSPKTGDRFNAGLGGESTYSPDIVDDIPPGFSKPLRLSYGMNARYHSSIPLFNLPHILTCPGKTRWCEKKCYTWHSHRISQTSRASRQRNYNYSKRSDFVVRMDSVIKQMGLVNYMRLHESGDFYDENYFLKWLKIINLNPNIKFLVYTRTPFDFDKYSLPFNLFLKFSTDDTSPYLPPDNPDLPLAYAGKTNKYGYFDCPKNTDPHAGCTPFQGPDIKHQPSGWGSSSRRPIWFSNVCLACWSDINVFLKEKRKK